MLEIGIKHSLVRKMKRQPCFYLFSITFHSSKGIQDIEAPMTVGKYP